MPFAPANGIELCYETFGDAAGRPLLLIMGTGRNRHPQNLPRQQRRKLPHLNQQQLRPHPNLAVNIRQADNQIVSYSSVRLMQV